MRTDLTALFLIVFTPALLGTVYIPKAGGPVVERTTSPAEKIEYTESERAAAAQFVSWISSTHPFLHRVFRTGWDTQIRMDFTQVPTGFLLPPSIASKRACERYLGAVEYLGWWWQRRSANNTVDRHSKWITGRDRPREMPVNFEAKFAERLEHNSFELLEGITFANFRWETQGRDRLRFSQMNQFPVLDEVPGRMEVNLNWAEAFTESEFQYLTSLVAKIKSGRVRQLTRTLVLKNIYVIAAAQQRLIDLVGMSRTTTNFSQKFEKFLETPEWKAVAHLSVPDDLPTTSLIMLPAPPEASTPVLEAKKEIPRFSAEFIENFLRDCPRVDANALGAIPFERVRNDVARAIDLLNATLTLLDPWNLDASAWARWRAEYVASNEGARALGHSLREYRDHSSAARTQFSAAISAVDQIRAWSADLERTFAQFTKAQAEALNSREQSALKMVLDDLPRLSVVGMQIITMLEKRLSLMEEQFAATTDLSLLVMRAQMDSLEREETGRAREDVRRALATMVAPEVHDAK